MFIVFNTMCFYVMSQCTYNRGHRETCIPVSCLVWLRVAVFIFFFCVLKWLHISCTKKIALIQVGAALHAAQSKRHESITKQLCAGLSTQIMLQS